MHAGGSRHAVVLSGGGGYGAYEIGVMRALFAGESPSTDYEPVDPAVVTGTSAGAFNAALLCSAPPGTDGLVALDYVEDVWLHAIAGTEGCGNNVLRFRGNPFTLLRPECAGAGTASAELAGDVQYLSDQFTARLARFADASDALEQRVLDALDASVLVSADRFVQVVHETVDLENIRRSERELRIAATNWRTGFLRIFANADMSDRWGHSIVLASTAIPGVFQTVEIEGDPYADGGLVMNTPLRPAIDAHAEVLHVIYMDPHADQIPLPRLRSTASTLYRLVVIALSAMMSRDIEIAGRINRGIDVAEGLVAADATLEDAKSHHFVTSRPTQGRATPNYKRLAIHRYHPHDDPGGTFRWLSFDRDRIVRMMDRGYEDARRHDCSLRDCLRVDQVGV
jgi:predicted acylesterase/phospholipase RssA